MEGGLGDEREGSVSSESVCAPDDEEKNDCRWLIEAVKSVCVVHGFPSPP